mmetsp:Transcript_49346/g.164731  ORF Transcript_49346/g.164731 Transcript_49346/m.164731 type:complete len:212 (-) Transcript_49346:767-1402(-)
MASTPQKKQKGRSYFGEMADTPGGNQTPKVSMAVKDSKFGENPIVDEIQVSATFMLNGLMLNGLALVEMGYGKEQRDALQAAMYEMADAEGCVNMYLPQARVRRGRTRATWRGPTRTMCALRAGRTCSSRPRGTSSTPKTSPRCPAANWSSWTSPTTPFALPTSSRWRRSSTSPVSSTRRTRRLAARGTCCTKATARRWKISPTTVVRSTY